LAQTRGTPTEVILDECIDLAKTYGGEDSASFVNGILDRLARQLRPSDPAAELSGREGGKAKTKAPSKAQSKAADPAKPAAAPKPVPMPKSTPIPKSKREAKGAARKP
jgi:hypothetical protein